MKKFIPVNAKNIRTLFSANNIFPKDEKIITEREKNKINGSIFCF
jgi:hypothetical protein